MSKRLEKVQRKEQKKLSPEEAAVEAIMGEAAPLNAEEDKEEIKIGAGKRFSRGKEPDEKELMKTNVEDALGILEEAAKDLIKILVILDRNLLADELKPIGNWLKQFSDALNSGKDFREFDVFYFGYGFFAADIGFAKVCDLILNTFSANNLQLIKDKVPKYIEDVKAFTSVLLLDATTNEAILNRAMNLEATFIDILSRLKVSQEAVQTFAHLNTMIKKVLDGSSKLYRYSTDRDMSLDKYIALFPPSEIYDLNANDAMDGIISILSLLAPMKRIPPVWGLLKQRSPWTYEEKAEIFAEVFKYNRGHMPTLFTDIRQAFSRLHGFAESLRMSVLYSFDTAADWVIDFNWETINLPENFDRLSPVQVNFLLMLTLIILIG
jgi:hypothetical protein